ncbi:MAG: SMC-Scp complex subunit ScpB [Clostridiales bacterium]|nr:SMC-Scp complex subunit ScpB [Clostridiales bacterium]
MTNDALILEAMLFASGAPVPAAMLSMAMGLSVKVVRELLQSMAQTYQLERRGFSLIGVNDAYQLRTNSIYYDDIKKLVAAPVRRSLTQSALETLSIIAYKQPVTRLEIEEIRGVNADHAVNRLLEYNLITEVGRLDGPGRPLLFGTTDEFLRYFGMSVINELPRLEELSDTSVPTKTDEAEQMPIE